MDWQILHLSSLLEMKQSTFIRNLLALVYHVFFVLALEVNEHSGLVYYNFRIAMLRCLQYLVPSSTQISWPQTCRSYTYTFRLGFVEWANSRMDH